MESPAFIWSNSLIFKLISLYEERRLLWDISNVDYKDKQKKNEAWIEIAKILDMDRETVERKMKILFTQFRREVAKVGVDSKWFAYEKLLFLKPRLEKPAMAYVDYEATYKEETIEPPYKMQRTETESEDGSYGRNEIYTRQIFTEKPKDELTIFGEHVTSKLRRIDNLYARCTAQYHINNILYRAETGEYDILEDNS